MAVESFALPRCGLHWSLTPSGSHHKDPPAALRMGHSERLHIYPGPHCLSLATTRLSPPFPKPQGPPLLVGRCQSTTHAFRCATFTAHLAIAFRSLVSVSLSNIPFHLIVLTPLNRTWFALFLSLFRAIHQYPFIHDPTLFLKIDSLTCRPVGSRNRHLAGTWVHRVGRICI